LSGHVLGAANFIWNPLSNVGGNTYNSAFLIFAPVACTASFKVFSFVPIANLKYALTPVTSSLTAQTCTAGAALGSCTIANAAASTTVPQVCSASGIALPANTPIGITVSGNLPATGTFYSAYLSFSCQ
jgi:hypothetical protein